MKTYKLTDFTRGWTSGNFDGAIIRTDQFEVCVKEFQAGDKEDRHYHAKTTEITIIIAGRVRMNGCEFGKHDVIVIEPNETTDFEALTDCTTVAYRNGSFPGDKFLIK